MPVFTLDTNIQIEAKLESTLKGLSQLSAELLKKPEHVVMVKINPNQHLVFAGSTDAAACCTLTSLNLDVSQCPDYSKAICQYLESELGIPATRIYIEFKSPERQQFGWNNKTFAE